jgi:lipopolysaccharide export system permease protein
MVYFNETVYPEANYAASSLAQDIRRKKPLAVIQERMFIEDIPGISLYVEDVNYGRNSFEGITIYQREEGRQKSMSVITAPDGRMDYDSTYDAVIFTLYNGEIHNFDPMAPENYTRGRFKRQTFRIGDLGTQIEEKGKRRRSDRELTTAQMNDIINDGHTKIGESNARIKELVSDRIDYVLSPSKEKQRYSTQNRTPIRLAHYYANRTKSRIQQEIYLQNSLQKQRDKYLVEIHKKYTLAVACLLFVFVGAPVGVLTRRGGMGTAIGFGMFFFFVYWVFLIGGEQLADRGIIHPVPAMWSSNVVMFIIGSYVLYRTVYDTRGGIGIIDRVIAFVQRQRRQK